MRILYLCADPGIPLLGGKGASVHVRSVTEALRRNGHDVVLVYSTIGSGNPAPAVQELVELDRDVSFREEQLRRVIRDHRVEVVIERYSLACGPGRAASGYASVPLILEVNAPLVLEAARHRGLDNVDEWLKYERNVFAGADAIGVVSSGLAAYVTGVSPQTLLRCIPNGVDSNRFEQATPVDLDLPLGSVAVGFAGSMKAWHGVTDLVDAMSRPEVDRVARLVLIGSGPQAAVVEQRIAERSLGDRVITLGQVEHGCIPSLLGALDIGVAPYLPFEGFYFSPIKVLEYLAAGLPVICPALGDLPEIVAGAGVLYRPGDVADLARAIGLLVDDVSKRRSLAAAARSVSRRLSWAANAQEYVQLAEAAMKSSRVTSAKANLNRRAFVR